MEANARPKLRRLEAFPHEKDGQTWICLHDPARYTDKVIDVPPTLFHVLTLIDGTRTREEIQQEVQEVQGRPLAAEDLEAVLSQLDEGLFLEGERFESHRQAQLDAFRNGPHRAPAHAGAAYPADESECRKALDSYFEHAEGPGSIQATAGDSKRLRALIAPHIDLDRGGVCSAHAFHKLASATEAPDLVVVFGTSHQPMERAFGLTRLGYDTPFGPVESDIEVLAALEERFGDALFEDELNHRIEHSIEFQALFLGYLYPADRRPRMLPVLVGSLHDAVETGGEPSERAEYVEFLEALRETFGRLGRRVVYLAGVDLAHVGKRFGAEEAPDEGELRRIEEADRASLGHLETLDGRSFFRFIAQEEDSRNVCGTAPITAMMELLDSGAGELLRYEQSVEPDTGSVVTYASMAFYE